MMVVADELLGLDATGQAELVACGEVSAIELVEAAAAPACRGEPSAERGDSSER